MLPLFLVSAATIGFEIALTRAFAVATWSAYGYWVISIVMVGFALSGVVLALARDAFARNGDRLLAALPALLVVAAAAGPVGSAVGQIAKIKGCRVVGIAGGREKTAYLTSELGFDAAVDHRSPGMRDDLKAACPNGIDIYFENVGGAVWDAVMPLLNNFARVPVCGLVANYNDTELPQGPDRMSLLMRMILVKRLRLQGFIVSDYAKQRPEFLREMGAWVKSGRVKYKEDIVEGLENAPQAFIGLLKGANFGKLIVKVA
jgi:NADPH-dependent curcumin reductase CurA